VLAYVLAGIGSAIGGLILSAQVSTASATYGNVYELDVIAAVILGGTSLPGAAVPWPEPSSARCSLV
jgi:ribose transport system permease protein